jgi:hypothetical protein
VAKRKGLTEELWFSCRDPEVLFFLLAKTQDHGQFADRLRANVGERKLRLFAAACCRTIWDLFDDSDGWLRFGVETCEREADQIVNRLQVILAGKCAEELWEKWQQPYWDEEDPHVEAALAVLSAANSDAAMAVFTYEPTATARLKSLGLIKVLSSRKSMVKHGAYDLELAILRDIFNPFVNSLADAAALGNRLSGVQAQARSIYEERAFADMPSLADALETAGCTDTNLIQHCREGQSHVPGCWAIDHILGWK